MGKVRAMLLATALAVCAGCSAVFPQESSARPAVPPRPVSPVARAKVGMSAADVADLLGKPVAIELKGTDGRTEIWHYEGGVVILRDEEVQFAFPGPPPQI